MDLESLDSDEILVRVGDMTGNGVADITLSTQSAVDVYRNPNARTTPTGRRLGCGPNFTLY